VVTEDGPRPLRELGTVPPGASLVVLAGRATREPQAAVTSGIQGTVTVIRDNRCAMPGVADLGEQDRLKLHGSKGSGVQIPQLHYHNTSGQRHCAAIPQQPLSQSLAPGPHRGGERFERNAPRTHRPAAATARVGVPFSPPGRATQLKGAAIGRARGATKKLRRGGAAWAP
jgi:hypothetical protein